MNDVFVIMDKQRLGDIYQFDTSAPSQEEAMAAAAEMARKTGLPCYVLGIIAVAEPEVTIKWSS